MARRKRQLLEDDSDSSPASDDDFNDPGHDLNDPDAREERALFEDPYKRKRRRKNGKEDAIYGVFGSDDEDGGFDGRRGKAEKRSDWTKAPAFVSGDKLDLDKTVEVTQNADSDAEMQDEGGDSDADKEDGEDGQGLDDSGDSPPPSPRIREEEEEEEEQKPRFGGLGLGAGKAQTGGTFSGFSKGGIGSSRPAATSEASPSPTPPVSEGLPSSFGAARAQRSFLRSGSGTPQPAAQLSGAERVHFSKLGGTFGARMLEKMGWTAGTGLGTTGEGIVTPIESKLRPKGMGIAFKGFKEKTEQSKAEARRRGEIVSDDEEESKAAARKARKAHKAQEERTDAWKKPKRMKTRVEHKTYEQIIAEAGQDAQPTGLGQIIDATGATPREVSSIADVSLASWTPTADPMRLPEIRHNLRLISEACKGDLDGLAREARTLEERRKFIRNEDARLRKRVEEEAELIARLQQVHLVVDDINSQAKEMASMYEASLEPFDENFEKLLGQYPKEFDRYRLDEIIVAAIAPVVRRMLAQWQPLEDPTAFTPMFRAWRRALKMAVLEEKPPSEIQFYGSSAVISTAPIMEKPMTPYESLLWNAWLPKVRSSINNDWSADNPQPAVRLYEAWSSFLPSFVRDNFFDQLVLPKVSKAVGDWSPRQSKVSLQTLVFPWLPHVGLRLEEILSDARRKVKSILRAWIVSEGMPKDLAVWKDVFDIGDWDTMLLKYIVPKLGSRLRDDFRVNPRNQDMAPLQDVMQWESLLRPSILSQLIETEFFPKWLDVLHVWLIQPSPSFEEVARWYSFWKDTFSENVQSMPGVAQGFTRGLQLMNKAIELGPDAPTRLPRPDHRAPLLNAQAAPVKQKTLTTRPARTQEITFRAIVEDFAASHNLLFIPAGRVHEKSRMPLFRVSRTADGKGGLLVYILDDAVWAPDGDEYRAITMEDMVLRAAKEK
ncbi:TFP11-domain-containing protein [Amylocystis lapponica]|nr:TFP11-domain-containing protein [Amylocystis lapponica]